MKAELAERIAAKKVLVVVGTGVSLATTDGDPLASWKGLITNGIERCVSLGRDATWGTSQKKLLEGDLNDLLGVAEQVSRRLGWKPIEPCDGDWNSWLRHTVGSLRAKNPKLIEAIRDLGAPIATLNYDDLLGEVTHLRTITWQRAERWLPVLQGEDEAILHLHGHWREPSSVVLGIRSYDAMMDRGLAQHLQLALASLKSLVFIGCSGTLEDPNFSSLLIWMRKHLRGADHSHYLLIREGELPDAESQLHEARIAPLRYGKEHADLLTFLSDIAPTAPTPVARKKPLRKPSPWFRGRTQQMEKLKSAIMGESRPCRAVVYGVIGVGKSELCIQLFYDKDIIATFGGNRYFVNLEHSKVIDIPFKISETLDLRIFGADPLEHVKRALSQSRSLLVLENFQAPFVNDKNGCANFLRDLIFDDPAVADDHKAPFHLVVSLRGKEWLATVLPWTTTVGLDPLDKVNCTALFNTILNNKFANDPDLPNIIKLTGGLPLIIELMAHHAETVPSLAEVNRRYGMALEQRFSTDLISRPENNDEDWSPLGQSLALAMSDPRLRKEGKRILSVLSCLPSGLAYEDVYEIFPSDALRGAEQLEVTGLASQSQERDRLYLLEPIRAYVKRRDPPTETDFRSLSNYFLKLADGGNYVHKENGSIWRRKLASEFDNIQIMIDKELESRSADLETRAMLATVALGRYQRFAGRGSIELLDKAISLHGNTKIINSALAEPQRRRGSIMNAKAIKRSIAVAECLRRRGSIMQMRSEPGGALKDFESAQAIYEGLPQTVQATLGIAECVSNRAESKRLLSDDSMAIDLFKMALDVYAQAKRIANTSDEKIMRGEAFCHQRLGVLAQGNLEYDEAREWYNHALTLFSAIGDLIGKALCKKGIGDLKTLSEKNVALQSYEEALRLFEDAQFERGAADCRYSLGDLAFSRRDCEQALVLYKHARSGYEKADSEHGKANCVYSISDVRLFQLYGNTDRPETTVPAMPQEVLADYEKAEAIFRKNKDYIAIANCLQGISDVLVLQGDTEGATRLRIEAARFVDLEFKNKPPDALFWVKPSGYFSGRWRK